MTACVFPWQCLSSGQKKSHQKAIFIPVHFVRHLRWQIGLGSHLLVVSKSGEVSSSPVPSESVEGNIWSRNHRSGARAWASRAWGLITMAVALQPWPGLWPQQGASARTVLCLDREAAFLSLDGGRHFLHDLGPPLLPSSLTSSLNLFSPEEF